MKVRDATQEDMDEIVKLYEEFCKEFDESPTEPPRLTYGKVVVLSTLFGLIGYGVADSVTYGKRSYTQGKHIYVRPQYRGTKAGGLIYSALRRWAKKEQRPIILLSAPNELSKWSKLGYKPIRYIMVKEIGCMK
jgi:GNAT superfamily N-acetyltransferase